MGSRPLALELLESQSERLLSFVLQSAGEAVFIHDLEGRLLEANQLACDMLGLDASDLIGLNVREIEAPVSGPAEDAVSQRLDTIRRTGGFRGWTALSLRNGGVLPVEVRSLLVEYAGAPAVVHVARQMRKTPSMIHVESEQRFAQALDAVSDGVWEYDYRADRFYRNDHWYRLAGFAPGELEVWEAEHGTIIHPDDFKRLNEIWARHQDGQTDEFRAEFRLRHKSGRWRWILGRGRMIERGPNGEPWRMIGTDTDITERKEAEESLRETARLRQVLLDSFPCVALLLRPGSREIVASNKAAVQVGAVPGAQCFRTWGQKEAPCPWCLAPEVWASGEARHLEIESLGVVWDAHWIPVADGLYMHYAFDVTERKRAEEALRLTQFSVEHTDLAVFWLGSDARFIYVNDAACESLGYTRDELCSMSVPDINPEFPEEVWSAHWEEIKKRGSFTIETTQRTKDGRLFPAEVTVNYLEYGGREYNFAFSRDITERRQAQEERRQLEAQVQHAQKLESLGVLAGGIAHDFNNLLAAILGNADLALLQLLADAPARACVEEIKTVARHAGHLTRQMLAYSGKGQLLVKPVNVNKQIEGMTHLLQASVTKKAAVHLDLAEGLPTIAADPAQIQQVVMNLLTNASDALGDNPGTIDIHTGVIDADRTLLSKSYADFQADAGDGPAEGRYVFIKVRDTGCGMDAETKARIFEPFFTTKFTGRGLGLAAVLGIVRGHNGAILVDSAPGKGTVFTVLFPCPPHAVEEEPAAPQRRPAEAPPATGTVLVVDDERPVRDVARRILERAGFAVLATGVARKAIELFRIHAELIGAVLLDMTMPELSGEEVFRELRRIRPGVRVVLTSGYTEQDALCRFSEDSLAGFVSKPFEAATLIAKMQRAIRP